MKNHEELKQKFLLYYNQLPSQRLAAASVGRNEDTILLWRKEDSDFSEQVDKAKAAFALENFKFVRDKMWILERVLRDCFSPLPVQEFMDRLDSMEKIIGELADEKLNK